MPDLPTGTVTFLFTDIEGSTRLWEQRPQEMGVALARHDALAAEILARHNGVLVKHRGEGDSLFAVFARAVDAVTAACYLQRALVAEAWPAETPLLVRMALHTGDASLRDGDFFGAAVNRCARLRAAGHGGQVLLSGVTRGLVQDELPAGASLRDLGLHRLRDLQRPEHVFQFLHPDLTSDFPPLVSLDAFPNNLPLQVTSFVGREKEMAEVRRLLEPTRLLTLTGTGGTGKTRLALQIAAELLNEESDGVWLVELAALADPALVPQAVASVLGVREEPGRSLTATLLDFLKPKKLLLVLDNCEHLLEACATLAEALLRGCAGVQILATSREGLNIAGETTYRLPSLSLPDPRALPPSAEGLTEFEAVRLFIDRASAALPSFTLTDADAPAVAQVCHRLDGIPLAIELAAARVKALPVETLRERLDDMFRLLTGGSRTALPRQQTLRALIDWSHDLLSPSERALLRRLAVFAGGWTLEAAEAVCAGEGLRPQALGVREEPSDLRPKPQGLTPPLELWQVLDLLTSLVEKSLVHYEEREGKGRYRLLETVRQYARDRLLEAGEAEAVRGRHRDWFLALAEEAEPELRGREQVAWLDRLEQEHDNLRAALAWSGVQGQVEAGLRLGGALRGFWFVRGYFGEGRERLAGLLALPGAEARTAARAKALGSAGHLAWRQGDLRATRALWEESLAIYQEIGDKQGIANSFIDVGWLAWGQEDWGAARSFWEEGLGLFQELGDKQGIAGSLQSLGWVAHGQGDCGKARSFWEEGLAIYGELGDKGGIANSLQNLGKVAHTQGDYGAARALYEESLVSYRELHGKNKIAQLLGDLGAVARDLGDSEAARALFEEGLAIRRELGDRAGIAWSLNCLGRVAYDQGNFGAARALVEESLAILRELGGTAGIADKLASLGMVAYAQGEHGAARALLAESLMISRQVGNKHCIVKDLEGLAAVAVAQGQPERAARLFGAAEALRAAMGAPLPPADRAEHDRSVAAARAALGEAGEARLGREADSAGGRAPGFAAAWAEGRAMTQEEVLGYALEESEDA